jgi:serine/threonine-protein kinase
LREAGFQVDVVETTDTTAPKGEVVRQSPQGGQNAAEGSTVTIVVSAFEEPSQDPSETDTPTDPESPTDPDSSSLPTDAGG